MNSRAWEDANIRQYLAGVAVQLLCVAGEYESIHTPSVKGYKFQGAAKVSGGAVDEGGTPCRGLTHVA
jgi:hypothetical protein